MKAHFISAHLLFDDTRQPWVVDKDDPSSPIMKISESDFNLFKSGIYRHQGNKIYFNGQTFWLPNKFMESLKIKSKVKGSNLSNLAISLREYLDPEVTKLQKFKIQKPIIESLANQTDDIYLFFSKNTKSNYQHQVKDIEESFKESGLLIKESYYTSETFFNRDESEISTSKLNIILGHFMGKKIKNGSFSTEKIDCYNDIYYHDDSKISIKMAKDINTALHILLEKSTNDAQMSEYKERIKDNDLTLILKEHTHNKSNPTVESIIPIENINLIKNFSYFNDTQNI